MLRFLVFGDLHLEDCTDGLARLDAILRHAQEEQVAFIVSLGDLCLPTDSYSPVMDRLRSCGIPVHHT
ncbi:MAG: metallophosphoesterase, partial [Clostridia bacterium]|nr:metallophosphoesterase [Clostridia bacterium]